jgi:small subunit ribosomal protein S8
MGMTDPIADMLTRIRNGVGARHEEVDVSWSRIKERIAQLMVEEGYLRDVKKVRGKTAPRETLRIQLRFDRNSNPVISGLKRVSRPGLRVYVGYRKIPPIRRGLGINIRSTPKGIMVDREARKAKLGGELVCSIW